jgi:thiamine pyrophosphokinase
MPLTSCSGVNLTGCEWPLKNANLTPDGSNSLSNVASGTVSVALENGIAILILAHPKLEVPHWD